MGSLVCPCRLAVLQAPRTAPVLTSRVTVGMLQLLLVIQTQIPSSYVHNKQCKHWATPLTPQIFFLSRHLVSVASIRSAFAVHWESLNNSGNGGFTNGLRQSWQRCGHSFRRSQAEAHFHPSINHSTQKKNYMLLGFISPKDQQLYDP